KAIWARDVPVELPFHTLAEERPLEISRAAVDEYAARLNRLIVEYVLAEQPSETLDAINRRLAAGARRGVLAAVAQELGESGVGYEVLRSHAVVGRFVRLLERLWDAALTDEAVSEALLEFWTTGDA